MRGNETWWENCWEAAGEFTSQLINRANISFFASGHGSLHMKSGNGTMWRTAQADMPTLKMTQPCWTLNYPICIYLFIYLLPEITKQSLLLELLLVRFPAICRQKYQFMVNFFIFMQNLFSPFSFVGQFILFESGIHLVIKFISLFYHYCWMWQVLANDIWIKTLYGISRKIVSRKMIQL